MLNKLRRLIEKTVAPSAVLSYSQSGEDLVLDFLANYRPRGFYVDVGSNDPIVGSNTYRFYRKGWRGICVDANSAFAPMYKAKRPRDIFVATAVSDTVQDVNFHHFAKSGLSSISGVRLYDSDDHYALMRTERLQTRKLSQILFQENCPDRFDFLSIDVEGHDKEVLASLGRYSPKIILIECEVSITGYEPVAHHWNNWFYLRSE